MANRMQFEPINTNPIRHFISKFFAGPRQNRQSSERFPERFDEIVNPLLSRCLIGKTFQGNECLRKRDDVAPQFTLILEVIRDRVAALAEFPAITPNENATLVFLYKPLRPVPRIARFWW
jgi:hypothetical protein